MWQPRVEDGAVVAEVPLRFVVLVFDLGGEAQWGLPGAGVEALFHGHLRTDIFHTITQHNTVRIFLMILKVSSTTPLTCGKAIMD